MSNMSIFGIYLGSNFKG